MSTQTRQVVTIKNNNGGILGGITNGMPKILWAVIKPPPQSPCLSAPLQATENAEISAAGTTCIVPRALPVVESVMALALLDLMEAEKR